MDSRARLHGELTAFLRQHCAVADERHLQINQNMDYLLAILICLYLRVNSRDMILESISFFYSSFLLLVKLESH